MWIYLDMTSGSVNTLLSEGTYEKISGCVTRLRDIVLRLVRPAFGQNFTVPVSVPNAAVRG
ncbi:MAG: hypothetical protein GX936_05555, partial [Clostridiales bacterium]|nr:hypothetical protein [Clostridiales bacterium]